MADPALKTEPPGGDVTAAEFYDWTSHNPGKYQLIDGHIVAMSPASHAHGAIQANLAREIGNHLAGPGNPCHIVVEPAVEVQIRANTNRRVPDLGVTCHPGEKGLVEIPEPVILIEILSSTNKKETWSNVSAYTTIPTVREILIVNSFRVEAQLLRRGDDGNWPADPDQIDADGTVKLDAIGFAGPLAAIYAKTYLEGSSP